jgi:hypothetical protein
MIFVTDDEMHTINNKLTVIIGNIDIRDRKGVLKDNVVKASAELKKIIGAIFHRNLKIRALLEPKKEINES